MALPIISPCQTKDCIGDVGYCVHDPHHAGFIVYCADCDMVSTTQPTRAEAINAWNNNDRIERFFDRSELVSRPDQ